MIFKTSIFITCVILLILATIYRIQDGVAPAALVFLATFSFIYVLLYFSDFVEYIRKRKSQIRNNIRYNSGKRN